MRDSSPEFSGGATATSGNQNQRKPRGCPELQLCLCCVCTKLWTSQTMKDPKRPETAPSADDSVYGTKTEWDRESSCTEVLKVSCWSVKSERSRGEPPIFSADPPDTDCECLNHSRPELHWQKKVKQKPENLFEDRLCEHGDAGVLQIFQKQLKTSLKQMFEPLLEGTRNTSVCVTEGLSTALHQKNPPSSVEISDLLSPGSVRTLLTVGSAGVGKTVLVQKNIVDWCEDRALQHIQLLCPLPVAQLNLLQQQSWTLLELLQTFCPGLRESGIRELRHYRLLFILDSLDECRLELDFSKQPRCCEPEAAMSVDALLTNLMLGNLLPEAQLWIICRPGAACSIPPTLIHRVSQVIGFSRHQQQLYLHHNKQDLQEEVHNISALQQQLYLHHNKQDLQEEVHNISALQQQLFLHLNIQEPQEKVSTSSEALHSLFSLPLLCSIAASVPHPLSLTQLLLHFLFYHMKIMQQRYGLQRSRVSAVVQALSSLALQQLQRGEQMFSEEQLRVCGLGVTEAVVYSGLCCQIFTEHLCGGHWTFSFVHPCLQEFLSALFIHTSSSGDRQDLHEALRDRPMVLHFLQELDMDSSVSELTQKNKQRGCSSETLTDSWRRSAQIFEAAPLSGREEPTVSEDPAESTARPQRHSVNPATRRSRASSCRSQARVNGEGQTKKDLWKLLCCSFKGTAQKLSGSTPSSQH